MTIESTQSTGFLDRAKKLAKRNLPPKAIDNLRRVKRSLTDFGYPITIPIQTGELSYMLTVGNRHEDGEARGRYSERDFILQILNHTRPGNVYCDIGAAIGTHTIPIALGSPNCKVFSLEPDFNVADALGHNIGLNGITNVSIFQIAAGNYDGIAILHTDGRPGMAPEITEQHKKPNGIFRQHIPMIVRRLDSLVLGNTIPAPDIIKIDVEGAGMDVLAGLGYLRPRDIFMEVHPGRGEELCQVDQLLRGRGYIMLMNKPRGGEIHTHFQLGLE